MKKEGSEKAEQTGGGPSFVQQAAWWRRDWGAWLQKRREPLELMNELWKRLPDYPTSLGSLAATSMRKGVPPEGKPSKQRGDDLLPLDPKGVGEVLGNVDPQLVGAVQLVVNTLNYLALGVQEVVSFPEFPAKPYTKGQIATVKMLGDRVATMGRSEECCPNFDEAGLQLATAKFDYMGEPIMPMEDLIADKVIAAWPKIGEAAVQDAVDLVPPALREVLLDPERALKPLHEWPSVPPSSRVRASDEEWSKIVAAGAARGLMVGIAPEEVFRTTDGHPVLNGAGAVKKLKSVGGETKELQRFISNLIPSNLFQNRLDGDDRLLPYLGQLTLLEQGPEEEWLVDSEDFTSCFNLFRLPPCWRKYMAFGKEVDASIFGGPPGKKVFPAMNVLPMGWLSSVAVIQSIVRTLVFVEAGVPYSSEVAKTRELPDDDDLTVIYLDSFDELRRIDSGCREVLENEASERHKSFLRVCEKRGLPLNAGKRLVAATRGSLQGGELDGRKGFYKLAEDKQRSLIGLGASLLAKDKWREFDVRHFVGKATFGMCFRRPLFAIFQNIFDELTRPGGEALFEPRNAAFIEVVMVISVTPLMCTNLRAEIDPEISVTDASPSGGGAAVATQFRRMPETEEHDGRDCFECGASINPQYRYPCPSGCGVALCSLKCTWAHRDPTHPAEKDCLRRLWHLPRFGERFAGRRAPLTHAIALQGGLEVQLPYDIHYGNDMFTDRGREELQNLCSDPQLVSEHWAPECRLFSKARGRPITLRDGTVIKGPQPVRDRAHVMGFPWLSGEMKSRLRQSNNMALKALKRGEGAQRQHLYWTLEHPYGSWLWEFTIIKRLEEQAAFDHAVGSHCCWGGTREKWYSFFGNLPTLPQFLHKDCPGHAGLQGYEVEQREDGTLHYPTEEEAEYPWELCVAYAQALKAQLQADGVFERVHFEERAKWYQAELEQSTARLAAPEVAPAAAAILARWESSMLPGHEKQHLKNLLRSATYRGSDVRLFAELSEEDSKAWHELPYPALRWEWKTVMSYPWKQEGHINELEMNAVAVFLKRRSRTYHRRGQRFFHVLDSMVSRGALAKGRSSSKRLNRVLRRCTAYLLAQDNYLLPLWSVSRWNFSDRASRAYEA